MDSSPQTPGAAPDHDEHGERLIAQIARSGDALRLIAKQLPSGLMIAAASGRVIYANPVAERILFHQPGASWRDHAFAAHGGLHPDGQPFEAVEYPMARAILEGEILHDEEQLYRRDDGTLTTLLVNAAPVRDAAGKTIGGVVGFIDIGVRKQAQEALRLSERRYRSLVDATARAVFTSGAEGWFIEPQPGWEMFTGQNWDDYGRRGGMVMVHPDDRERVRAAWYGAVEQGAAFTSEYRLWNAEASAWSEVLVRAVPVRDDDGKLVEWVGTITDITDAKRADAELRRVQDQVGNILESMTDAFYAVDLEWRFTYLNREAEQLLQRGRDELLGRRLWDEIRVTTDSRLHCELRRAMDDKVTVSFEEYEASLAGWFEVRAYPSRDGLAVYLHDISERKRAEERLREQDEELSTILDNVPVIISYVDAAGRFRRVNRRYEQVFGRSADWVTGKTLDEVAGEPHSRIAQPYIERALAGSSVAYESRLRDRAGEVRDISVSYTPQVDAAGAPAGFIAMVEDITERKRAEEYRARLTEALELERARLQAVLEQMPAGVLIVDSSGRTLLANERVKQLLGRAPVEARTLEEHAGYFATDGENGHARDDSPLVRAIAFGEVVRGKELAYRSPEGGRRTLSVSAAPIRDAAEAVVAGVIIFDDVTERREIEEALRRSHDELVRVNNELEQFAYVASHDLREPLRAVNAYSQLLLRRMPADPDAQQFGAFIRHGVLRMSAMIDGVLAYSRVLHAEASVESVADLNEAVQDAVSLLQQSIEQSGAELVIGPLPTVRGDRNQWAQVFQNLISNAVKYRSPERRASIVIGAEDHRVSVRDNGIGFSSEYAERIFGLFKRLHRDEYAGTGLGLAICRRIVERYGGRIWAESRPDEGATFIFEVR